MSTVISDEETAEYLSANVRRLLISRGLSLRALADKSGEYPAQISRIVNLKRMPNVATVARIAEALDVTIDVLLRPSTATASTN